MPKKRVFVYFDDSDIEYLDAIGRVCGVERRSEQIRFCMKLLRMILPRVGDVVEIVSKRGQPYKK